MSSAVTLPEYPATSSIFARLAHLASASVIAASLLLPMGTPRAVPAGRVLLVLLADARLTARAPPLLNRIAVASATFSTPLELIRFAAIWELGLLLRSAPPAAAGGTLGSFTVVIAPVVSVARASPSTSCDRFVIPHVIHRFCPDGE